MAGEVGAERLRLAPTYYAVTVRFGAIFTVKSLALAGQAKNLCTLGSAARGGDLLHGDRRLRRMEDQALAIFVNIHAPGWVNCQR